MRRTAAALWCAALAACVSAGQGSSDPGAGSSPALGFTPLRRQDRAFVTRMRDVQAVAASARLVFVATPFGLAIYDRQFDRWLPTLTVAEGWRAERVSALAGDPVTDAVWIGTSGAVVYYRPTLDQAVRAPVPGRVEEIAFDRRDAGAGALARIAGAWYRVSSTGVATPVGGAELPPPSERVLPARLPQLYREYPGLDAFERLLTRDEQLRSWPVSAGTKSPDRSEVWLGTRGDGLFQVDPLFNKAIHREFGLLDRGVGAVALAADGVWIAGAGDPRSDRGGVVFASSDLQRWRWVDARDPGVLAGARAFDLAVRNGKAWVATDRGLLRLDVGDGGAFAAASAVETLPDDRVFALAATSDGVWVGTARGATFVADSAGASARRAATTIAGGTAVRALLLTGDTLWLGTDAGLLLLRRGDRTPSRPAAARAEPRLLRPVRAVVRSDSVVAVGLDDALLRIDLRTGRAMPPLGAVDIRAVGGIAAMAMDARTIWVAGPLGVLVVDRDNAVSRFLRARAELPGQPTDVALDSGWAWVGTTEGLLRLRRLRDGTLP